MIRCPYGTQSCDEDKISLYIDQAICVYDLDNCPITNIKLDIDPPLNSDDPTYSDSTTLTIKDNQKVKLSWSKSGNRLPITSTKIRAGSPCVSPAEVKNRLDSIYLSSYQS
jgi:hypothetical protein